MAIPERLSFNGETALCGECLNRIPYALVISDSEVVLQKTCPEHGLQEVVLSTDVASFRRAMAMRELGGADSTADHLRENVRKPYMLILEILDECDLECPTCIAYSKPGLGNVRSRQSVIERVSRLTDKVGTLPLIMVSGGEPALHPELIEIVSDLQQHAQQVMIITNGQRIAADVEFVDTLSNLDANFEVYLQFDSLRGSALKELRGADYRQVRLQAVENLRAKNIATTLVCVIKKGVNDDEVCDIVRFASKFSNVRGVTFQPIRSSGRHLNFAYSDHSVTSSQIRRDLIQGLRIMPDSIMSHPLNPEHICIGYFGRENGTLVPRTRELYANDGGNFATTSKVLYLTKDMIAKLGNGPDLLRITIVTFLDKYNFTSLDSHREGIMFLTDEGKLVSIDQRFM